MSLHLMILIPIALGMFLYISRIKYHRAIAIAVQSVVLAGAGYLFVLIDIIHQEPFIQSLGFFGDGHAIYLYADDISAMMVIMTAFLFLLALIYGSHKPYMNHQFLFLFLVLEGLIIGTFLAQDLFTLYAIIEVSTIVVAVLILYKRTQAALYDGVVYLFTNLIAMAFYLVGVGFVYKIFGTLDMLTLRHLIPQVEDVTTLILPYAFMMTAIGLKSAVMPLFSWLPHAHGSQAAPYIVSAILSGLYVKGSLYIFIRLQDIFGAALGTETLFIFLGFFTSVLAMILALSQTDIKLILAYSTVSQIGLIIIGVSLNSVYSRFGAIYHIFNHGLFKTALFLMAGILIDTYGTRDLTKMKGIGKKFPLLSITLVMALLGITGAPLFNGSISKYLITKGISSLTALEYGILLVNIGTITYVLKFIFALQGDSSEKPVVMHRQQNVILVLSALCLVFGIFGHHLVHLFFDLRFDWTLRDYMEKTLIYGLSVLAAVLFYHYFYEKGQFFQRIQEIELTFNELIYSIVFFFTGLLGYLMIIT